MHKNMPVMNCCSFNFVYEIKIKKEVDGNAVTLERSSLSSELQQLESIY